MRSKENKCFICNKFYSSYKSWWNHNKQFHKNETVDNNIDITEHVTVIPNIITEHVTIITKIKKYNCSKCNKLFNNYQNRWKHEKICKLKNIQPITENKIEKLKKENEEIKNTISELKNLILQQVKTTKIQQKNNTNIDILPLNNILSQNNVLDNNLKNNIIEVNNSNNEFINFTQNTITFDDKLIKFLFFNEQVYMKANNITKILDYGDLDLAIRNNVDIRDKFKISDFLGGVKNTPNYLINSNNDNIKSESSFLGPVCHTISHLIDLLKNEDPQTIFINESGFYSLIFGSKKDIATQFKYWITSKVLPKNYSKAIVLRTKNKML